MIELVDILVAAAKLILWEAQEVDTFHTAAIFQQAIICFPWIVLKRETNYSWEPTAISRATRIIERRAIIVISRTLLISPIGMERKTAVKSMVLSHFALGRRKLHL